MNLISRAADCSIKTFIAVKFDGKLDSLIISGKPTEDELKRAFEQIETEYNDLLGTVPAHLIKMNKVNKQLGRVALAENAFVIIEGLVERVFDTIPVDMMQSDEADEYLEKPIALIKDKIVVLQSIGVRLNWTKDIIEFKKAIKKAKKIESSQTIRLKELRHELEASEAQITTSPQYTRTNFTKLKIAVQSLVGYNIPENETNMHDYGIMCFSYFEMIKNQSPN